MIAQETIYAINNLSILDVAERLGLKVKNHQLICPAHNDTRPSLYIKKQSPKYASCYVCGAFYNPINFYMTITGLDFLTTIENLASLFGITIKHEHKRFNYMQEIAELKTKFNLIANTYHMNLCGFTDEAIAAKEYLLGRKFHEVDGKTLNDFINRNQLGLALPSDKFDRGVLEDCGLLSDKGNYLYYTPRLIFPIHDARGNIVGFSGRDLTDESDCKYLASKFKKNETAPYGYKVALDNKVKNIADKKQSSVFVVEGYTDVLACHQHGIYNCVALNGVSISEYAFNLLRKNFSNICFVLDADKGGDVGSYRIAMSLLQHIKDDDSVWFSNLSNTPETFYGDICDFLTCNTGGSLLKLIRDTALPYKDFIIKAFKKHTISESERSHDVQVLMAKRAFSFLDKVAQAEADKPIIAGFLRRELVAIMNQYQFGIDYNLIENEPERFEDVIEKLLPIKGLKSAMLEYISDVGIDGDTEAQKRAVEAFKAHISDTLAKIIYKQLEIK
jgi:DNA primase